ncbi:MAG: SDR family NAD(P)-dependent oxidoreductase [Planctomycetaceae bacterium]
MIDAYADRWALVTGASSGIGEAFARQLAARGMHLVVAARRQDRLEKLAEDLHTRHGTLTDILSADLSDPEAPARLLEEIRNRERRIEVLVNNAGFAVVGDLLSTDRRKVMEMLNVNVAALTELTYGLLPDMKQRGHGAIVNVSSVAGFQPVAYMGAYAATKAYVLHFSEALWAEVRDAGVTVMALCPGVTRTEFFDVAGVTGWLKKQRSHSPDRVVRKALKALEKKRQCVVPGFWNRMRSLFVRLASRKRVVRETLKYFRPRPPKGGKDTAESL